MTVEELIERRTAALASELASANSAITAKGGTGDATTISGLADAIDTIPTGGAGNPNVFVYEVQTTTNTLTITHSLGVAPTRAACICMDMDAPSSGTQKLLSGVSNIGAVSGIGVYYNSSGVIDAVNGAFTISGASETSLTFGSNRNFYGGSTYLFIFA